MFSAVKFSGFWGLFAEGRSLLDLEQSRCQTRYVLGKHIGVLLSSSCPVLRLSFSMIDVSR